jgi:hypothetical protein
VTYEIDEEHIRWLARAVRNIKKGEEMRISYLLKHCPKEERLNSSRNSWGFDCDCPKCLGGPDEYTASLEAALDVPSGGKNQPPPMYGFSVAERQQTVTRRIDLLTEINKKMGVVGEDNSRLKELIFA